MASKRLINLAFGNDQDEDDDIELHIDQEERLSPLDVDGNHPEARRPSLYVHTFERMSSIYHPGSCTILPAYPSND